MIRAAVLAIALAAAAPAAEYVQAVEFPYYLYPHALWERELVWLKNIGIQTVAFSVPWNFHQTAAGETDLTGKTSPRRDLAGFVRLLRKLGLRGWVRPMQPAAGLLNGGGHPDAAQQRAWLKQLDQLLATQTTAHGGPIAYMEGRGLSITAPAPPAPVTAVSATDAAALALSRQSIASAKGSLLWTDVEDAIYPAGWAADPTTLLRKGAVGLSGDEHAATGALRRNAALLRGWSRLLSQMRAASPPKGTNGKLPDSMSAVVLSSPAAGAVSLVNTGTQPFHDDLRVTDPVTRKVLVIPGVTVPAGQALWLPVSASIGPDGLCSECTQFSASEHIVYATAELVGLEYENGILAMEFAAPQAGEAVLQLARRPVGPFLAAGKPTEFEWDERNLRARLTIPASQQPGNRVRIGIAIEAPDTSAFFNELRRLVIGRKNTVSTVYSSGELAARSRLRLPDGYTASAVNKSPNEIDYEVSVPADALHGDYANLAIEADGVALGRARVQLFRPVSVRLMQGLQFHFGPVTEMTPDPPVVAIDPRAGANLEIALRNNTTQIQTYHVEFAAEGLEFFPAKTSISVAPADERRVEFRAFAGEGVSGLRDFNVRIKGSAEMTVPMRLMLVPRGQAAVWSADLDGDGIAEWILESARVRAVFSMQDGGRWMEFTWKDTNTNFLPEGGLFALAGAVEVRALPNGLELAAAGWKRTVTLNDTTLAIEQSVPLPATLPGPEKRGNITFSGERSGPGTIRFTLK